MLSLVKIRARYLSRHKCVVYFSYFFIPTLIFILLVITAISNEKLYYIIKDGEKIYGEEVEIVKIFDENEDFSEFQEDFGIVSENKEDCYIINNLINKNKSISLACDTQEKDFINDNINYIKIINDNGKYNIELIEVKYHSFIDSEYFYYDKFADPFYYETSFSVHYYHSDKKIYKYETLNYNHF